MRVVRAALHLAEIVRCRTRFAREETQPAGIAPEEDDKAFFPEFLLEFLIDRPDIFLVIIYNVYFYPVAFSVAKINNNF